MKKVAGSIAEFVCIYIYIWGFPTTRGTILGVPIIRIIVFWGLYWGGPF